MSAGFKGRSSPPLNSVWTLQPSLRQALGSFPQGARPGILIYSLLCMGLGLPLESTLSGFLPSATEPLKLLEVFPVLGSVRLTGPWASSLPQSCRQTQSESQPNLERLWCEGSSSSSEKTVGRRQDRGQSRTRCGGRGTCPARWFEDRGRAPLPSLKSRLGPRQLTKRTCACETTPGSC